MTSEPTTAAEAKLIQQSKEGDHSAFKRLYDMNVVSLFRFMSQFSVSEDQVKDWVQRAFIKAYENLASFEGISLFSTWLFKLALNEMRMDFRRAKIISFIPTEDEVLPAVEDERTAFEWDQTMKRWLDQLDEMKRMVFILYEVEGYSHAEVAGLLQIQESTSRTLLTRTRQFLRKQWKEEQEAI